MAENKEKTIKIEISLKTVLIVVGVIIGVYFLYTIRTVLALFFWGFVLASALIPIVKRLQKIGIPRFFSIVIVYALLLITVLGLISAVSVPIIGEFSNLIEKLPEISVDFIKSINNLGRELGLDRDLIQATNIKNTLQEGATDFIKNISENSREIVTGASSLIGGIFKGLSMITISFYITLHHDDLSDTLFNKIPNIDLKKKVKGLIDNIESKLGNWLLGQAALSLIAGFQVWIVLSILNVPFALPLAILAALMDSVPTVGATLAAVPALLISLTEGNIWQTIGVAVGYILIQQIENNILIPRIMSNFTGLPPIVVLFAILIGAQLFGITGVLLAVPLTAVINLAFEFFAKNYKKKT